jgi:serine/threonine protein kinase
MNGEQRYKLIQELGSGSFGVVYLGIDNQEQRQVAIKRVEKSGDFVSREYEILSIVKDCQNCITLLDFFYSNNVNGQLTQNMVFEYLPTNLENVILIHKQGKRFMSEDRLRLFAFQILTALADIHEKGVVHRDLKPENILMREEIIRLADFGSSKLIEPTKVNTPYIVSRYYRAPELLLCCTQYDEKIDMWAAGCILAEMCSLEPVFRGSSDGDQLFAILRVLGSFSKSEADFYIGNSSFSEAFFSQVPRYKRQQKDIDLWFTGFSSKPELNSLIKGMLTLTPKERISAAEAIQSPFFDSLRPSKTRRKKFL